MLTRKIPYSGSMPGKNRLQTGEVGLGRLSVFLEKDAIFYHLGVSGTKLFVFSPEQSGIESGKLH
jgi:hypothetical protein